MIARTLFACLLASVAVSSFAQIGWTMRDFNLERTGANTKETVLSPSNVNTGQFGKLFSRQVDGQIYAQPLVVPGVVIAGKGTFTAVYVATMHDSVYAFDAENPTSNAPLWSKSFIDEANGVTTIPYQYLTGYGDIHPEVGIVSTPAINKANNTMYVVVRTLEGDPNDDASYHQRLHALDLRTGAEKFGGPVELAASQPGGGDGSVGGFVSYNGRRENQRPALILANNKLYIAAASHGDTSPYHGWVLSYNPTTLKLNASFCSTPNAGLGGIWMSGHGMPVDSDGNIYLATGNGAFDPTQGNYGDSFVKLNGTTLAVMDYFTPYNQQDLDDWDADLGSCGPILIPNTNLLVGGSKESKLYVMDRTNMGHYNPAGDTNLLQWWWAGNGHIHGSPIYWKGSGGNADLYMWSENDSLKGFKLVGGAFQETPFATSAVTLPPGMPGGFLTESSNGAQAASAIIWATVVFEGNANWDTVPGVLRAFRATDLTEIWNSKMIPDDDFGNFAKFNNPVVVNGKVYVPTFSNQLVVYGQLPAEPPSVPNAVRAEAGDSEIAVTWTASRGAASYEIRRGPLGGPYVKVGEATSPTFFDDTALTNGQTYDYIVVAKNTYGDSDASNSASATPSAIPAETGTGITANYYSDPVEAYHFFAPLVQRKDANIDFDWGAGSPGTGIPDDQFSVIWKGYIVAPQTGFYTFQTITDDGTRLWLRDRLAIDDWTDHAPTSDFTQPILLVKGTKYPIQMEMYENGGGATARLWWTGPGISTYAAVPKSALFPFSTANQVVKPITDGAMNFESLFNLDGMSYAANPLDGDIGSLGQTYPSELLPDSFTVTAGTTYVLPVGPRFNHANNMFACAGQTLMVPASEASSLQILGCSVNGTQTGTLHLTYSDGVGADVPLAFTDWGAPSPRNGEKLQARYSRRHSPSGDVITRTSIYRYSVPANSAKRLISITLPTNADMKILSINIRR